MSDMSSLPRLDDKIEEILMSYLKVESFTDTIGETDVDTFFNKTVGNMSYFKKHKSQYGQYDILNDPLNRHVNYAFYKGSNETFVLLHHSDIVNVDNYSTFKSIALDPKSLEKAYLNDDSFIDINARKDLHSGEYLWGRGVADMKGGGAIQLALLEHYSTTRIKPSILLLAVPDEENQSLGMRTAIELLQELKEVHGLDYKLMINSEPHQRLNETHGIISQGSIGKLNIFVHVKGVLAHAGKALEGINPNGLLSYIVSRVDLSDDFVNETDSEMSIPPTWVLMRDNKSSYDISFPSMSYGLLNVLSFTDTPLQILSRLKSICKEAVDDYIEHINIKRRKFSKKTSRNWIDFSQGDYVHTLEEFLSSNSISRSELINYPDDVERALKATNDGEPMVIIGILPPYYPAVTNRNQDKLINLVNEFTQAEYDQIYDNRMYFTGISDLSYSQLPIEEIENEMINILGWQEIYSIPFETIAKVEMPCINIGPFGKDFHKPSERVLKEDLFIRTPQIINHTILNY
ncbi:MAG: M20/M25/M40 family metallo-hydrolase [Clostridiales bacterium]|nr:M20/M25/M40 family metallo-hydrolase [Clostridiales bacterium]